MKGKLALGLLLVAVAIGVILFFGMGEKQQGPGGLIPRSARTVRILYGSEKQGLLHDEEFRKLLANRYGLTVDGAKMGSLEMADAPLDGVDGVWPSSELAALVFKERRNAKAFKSQNIFNTPIVFYSWPEVVEALERAGVASKRDDHEVVDAKALLDLMLARRDWRSLGLARQNGLVTAHSTDPTKSNSGFLVAGLLSALLAGPDLGDAQAVDQALRQVAELYGRLGYLENSTGILFDKYIKQGQGAFPLIAAYESLVIEFHHAHPEFRDQIRERIRVLLPEPTVWSEHPFIALGEGGEKLLLALQDKDIQQLAWTSYGFRSGILGLTNDPAVLKDIGLPERVDSVMPLPSSEVMERLLSMLSGG